jgi:hypothetical protein
MWSEDWNAVRGSVLERDAYACRNCPTDVDEVGVDGLHAHHVRPRADGGPDERANLLTLCEDCHGEKHSGRTTYLDGEFLQTVHGYGPLTSGEVADWMGCSRTTARRRLSALADAGDVERVERSDGTRWRPPRSVLGRILAALTPFR